MGLRGILRFFVHRTVEITVLILLILFMPSIPPHANFLKSYNVEPAKPFEGKLALNTKLNNAEIWHKGELHGPEAFAEFNGDLYTTVHGGDVVKLVGEHIIPIAKFGKPCKGAHQEKICGRPLGLTFDKSGTLFVADAYYGIYKVNVETGKYERLVAVDDVIGGLNVTLPNSIAVAQNGDLFWTDSSTEFTLQDGVFDMLADGSGRLIHYDARTKKNTVLIPEIHFANGVLLSDDEEFVVVSETARARLLRYYLKGPKKGTHDIFIDGLPGMTDNLNSDGKGGFLVPLVIAADAGHPSAVKMLGPFPHLRKLLARVLGLVQVGFKFVDQIYPNEYADRGIHMIGHFQSMAFTYPKRVTVLRISKTGEILDSLHTNQKLSGISAAHIYKDSLYLGSPFNDYIGRIPLAQIGWEHLKFKPTTTTARPTTTTPKPTTTTRPTTTTPRPTTTTPKPTTTTPRPTTTTPKPTTTTPRPTTTTPRPAATTTTAKPTPKVTQARPAAPTTTKPAPQAQQVKDQPKAVPVKEAQKVKK